jgi:hypothetical protein
MALQKSKAISIFEFKDFTEDVAAIVIENYSRDPTEIKVKFLTSRVFQTYIEKTGTFIIVMLPDSMRKILLSIKACTLRAGVFDVQIGFPPKACIPVNIDHLAKEYFIFERTMIEMPFSESLSKMIFDVIKFNTVLPLHQNCIYNKQLRGMSYVDVVREALKMYKSIKNTSSIASKDIVPYTPLRMKCEYCYYDFLLRDIDHLNKKLDNFDNIKLPAAKLERVLFYYKLGAARRYDKLLEINEPWDYDVFLYGWLENLENSAIKSIGLEPIDKYDEFLDILDILGNQDIIDLCAVTCFEKYITNHNFIYKILKRKPTNLQVLLLLACNQSADKIIKYMTKHYGVTLDGLCEYVTSTTAFTYTIKNLTSNPEGKISKLANKHVGILSADPYIVSFIYEQYGMENELPDDLLLKLNIKRNKSKNENKDKC